jgi:non-specific serine/threonine protein kinase
MTEEVLAGPATALQIKLFGAFEVRLHGGALPALRSRKGQWLLALLTLRPDQQVPRSWLAGTLWPESREQEALYNLRRCLSDLRRALGSEGPRLKATSHTLLLDLSGAHADVVAFDALVKQGDRASLEQGIALYRGPLLEGCLEEWVVPERQEREQSYLSALETLAQQGLERKEFAAAVQYLRLVVTIDPLRESAQRTLMLALAADGEYAAALQVYRDLRLLLQRELTTEPDPQTQSLFQQIREEVRRRAQPRPALASAPSVSPYRLPRPLTSLVGRQQEIQEVAARLLSSRLVTLTGTGGVGKTRLAIAVAEAQADDFAEGVFFVDLSALSESTLVAQAVALVLELREQSERSFLQTLTDYLEPKEVLLVWDNCEHLLAGCAPLAQGLLSGCPRLRLLATSRQALGLTGEMAWPVPALSFPQGAELASPEKMEWSLLLEYDAVQLFVERGQQALPSFRLSGKNAAAVVQICAHLDGIPLAIELAAARLRAMTAEQIAARLDDRFRLLTGGSRAVLPRQQTLRAMLDWSYELLTEQECLLLHRLSAFAGGWTLEAAESVCSGEDIEDWEAVDLLTSLVDKSLVVFEEREGGEGRYRLLETIRHYAQERLTETGEEPELQRRHRDFFLALAEEAEPHLQGAEQGVWINRLETEHENLRSALGTCQAMGEVGAETGLRLCGALQQFWWIRGHLSEGRAWAVRALSQVGSEEQTQWRAKALTGAAGLAYFQSDYASARAYQEESLAIFREIGDRQRSAAALNYLGMVAYAQGDYASACAFHEQSLAIQREIGNQQGIAYALNGLGIMAQNQGDYALARAYQEESLAIQGEIGDRWGCCWSLLNLGNVARMQGDYASARAFLEESLTIQREIGNRGGSAFSLESLAALASAQEQPEQAARLWGAAERLREEIGAPLPPNEREEYDHKVSEARAALGEEAFTAAWTEGRAMSWEHAVYYALGEATKGA